MKKLSELSLFELKNIELSIDNEIEALQYIQGNLQSEIYFREHPETIKYHNDTNIDVEHYLKP